MQILHSSFSATLKQVRQNFTFSVTSIRVAARRRTSSRIGRQQVERDPLGPFRADTGKLAKLVDQILDDSLVHLSASPDVAGSSGSAVPWQRRLAGQARQSGQARDARHAALAPRQPPRPPASGPIISAWTSPRARYASRHAASTRSASVDAVSSGSPGSMASLAMAQIDQLALPVDRRLDQAAPGAALDLGLGQPLLSAHKLALHLCSGSEELLHIELPTGFHAAVTCSLAWPGAARLSGRPRHRLAVSSRLLRAYGLPAGPARWPGRAGRSCRLADLLDHAAAKLPHDQVLAGHVVTRAGGVDRSAAGDRRSGRDPAGGAAARVRLVDAAAGGTAMSLASAPEIRRARRPARSGRGLGCSDPGRAARLSLAGRGASAVGPVPRLPRVPSRCLRLAAAPIAAPRLRPSVHGASGRAGLVRGLLADSGRSLPAG